MPKSTNPKSTAKKSTARDVLVQVQTRGDKTLTARAHERLAELEARDKAIIEQQRQWLLDVVGMAKQYSAAKKQYRDTKYRIISDVYAKYLEIEHSGGLRNGFYRQLREKLTEYGYKVQSNTPDAGLLLRLVLGKSPSPSSINQYVKVLNFAQECQVKQEDFVDWVKKITISKASAQQTDDTERRKQRLERARILILQYLDWRETNPVLTGKKKMLAHTANSYVTKDTNLVVMIGTAMRKFDNESDYADIYVSHILPHNFGLEVTIIDKFAKYIEPELERHEADMQNLPDWQWTQQLEEELWARDVAEAEKQSINWQLRQQAALYEDQQQFAKYASAFKKQKQKESKSVKTTKPSKTTKAVKSTKPANPRKAVKKTP